MATIVRIELNLNTVINLNTAAWWKIEKPPAEFFLLLNGKL